jgi:hypothetical protein
MNEVAIIIINYNGTDNTINCLKALDRQTYKSFEVIVVDNGSSGESEKKLSSFFCSAKFSFFFRYLPLKTNLGFSGGNNRGLEASKAIFIALLNNDTEPHERWIEQLVGAMKEHPDVGICASKMLIYNTRLIDSAGDGFLRSLKAYKRGEGESDAEFNQQEFVFGACAGAALYRRSMIDQIGFLDEDFFLIHEDSDFNFRAQMAGWKVLFVPTAIVGHKVRSSIGHHSDTEVYYTLRNSYFVKIKNAPLGLLVACFIEIMFTILVEFIYFVFKHRQRKLYFKAIFDTIAILPRLMSKRRANMKYRATTNRYLLEMMTPVLTKKVLRAKLRKFLHD